jgi:hypothetical protein
MSLKAYEQLIESDDEGFEEDYPPEFPFWYATNSGPLTISKQIPVTSDITESPLSTIIPELPTHGHSTSSKGLNRFGRLDSYRDQDSCLHYFISTTQSEVILDDYMSRIIRSFLTEKGLINAFNVSPKSPTHTIPSNAASSQGLEEYLFKLKTNVIDKATRTSAPRMIGHMTTALPYFHRPLARLIAAMNQNVVKVETASTFTSLERQTIAMLHNSFYAMMPDFYQTFAQSYEHCLGIVCSGGTVGT